MIRQRALLVAVTMPLALVLSACGANGKAAESPTTVESPVVRVDVAKRDSGTDRPTVARDGLARRR